MYSVRCISLIDNPNYNYKDPFIKPLVTQRYHGIFPYDITNQYLGRFIYLLPS